MRIFLKICSIVSIMIATVKLAMMGNLSQGMVHFVIICGIIISIGNQALYIIATAVAALVLFIKIYGGSSADQMALLQSILTLSVMILGLYIMLRGFIRKGNRSRYR